MGQNIDVEFSGSIRFENIRVQKNDPRHVFVVYILFSGVTLKRVEWFQNIFYMGIFVHNSRRPPPTIFR